MSDQCKDILIAGVYEYHIAERSGNMEQDYKRYFTSEEFKKDFKDFKFKYGVETFVDGVLNSLNINASDTEINEFQRKIREGITFVVKESFFEKNIHLIPNKSIIEAWKDCVTEKFGFQIKKENIGNYVKFTLKYNNFGNASLPTLQSISVVGGLLKSRTKTDGEAIAVNEDIVAVCAFVDDMVMITFDTDFSPISETAEKFERGKATDNIPLGTIISSYLNWEEFQRTTDNNKYTDNGLWNGLKSNWAPCDGRQINGSDFFNLTNQSNTPDLRGAFLRALNVFDRYENDNGINSVIEQQKDPQSDRVRGSFQADEFRKHSHFISQEAARYVDRDDYNNSGWIRPYPTSHNINTAETGGAETRPKNVAIYYYIKINK
jgi:hypothetical protein